MGVQTPPPSQQPPQRSTLDKIVKGIAITILVIIAIILVGGGLLYAACSGIIK